MKDIESAPVRNLSSARRTGLLLGLGLFAAAATASASLMVAMDLSELTQEADRIVVASVLSVQSEWDSSHRRILSRIEIKVEEAWKGEVMGDGRLTLVQPGGMADDVEMIVHGMPRFSLGERAVLFLAGETRPVVVGMAQGKRSLRWDSGGRRWMAQAVDRMGLLAKDARSPATVDPPMPLEQLRQRVRALINK